MMSFPIAQRWSQGALLLTLLLGSLCSLGATASAQVSMTEGPIQGQLYPRDLVSNQALVMVSGTVTQTGFSQVQLTVNRDGLLWWSQTIPLNYSGGSAPFSFQAPLDAGLFDYSMELLLESGGVMQVIDLVGNIACGDAYLINGQSNALAADYYAENLGNRFQSRWIRSFGTASTKPTDVVADQQWHLADALLGNDAGTIGAWGLRAAWLLVERYQIPIAILNGSVGGSPLYQHHRNPNDPEDLDTIYGRLLYRTRKAGLDQNIRAMMWHQGESSGNVLPNLYTTSFGELIDEWHLDFPAMEHTFVFQIRGGCGVNGMGIREAQRRWQDHFPNLTTIPTAGIDGHDKCHFYYRGYQRMGDFMAAALTIMYNEQVPTNAAPPNIRGARFTSAAKDEIDLIFRDPQQVLVLSPSIISRLRLRNGGNETIVLASTTPGHILLQLSGPSNADAIAYIGNAGSGPWIKNTLGVGAYTFEVPL
jgi:Carbohydrate esterase, sialic acid-specific acetylesterase